MSRLVLLVLAPDDLLDFIKEISVCPLRKAALKA